MDNDCSSHTASQAYTNSFAACWSRERLCFILVDIKRAGMFADGTGNVAVQASEVSC